MQTSNVIDPMVGTIPGTLHARVRSERRYEMWAPGAEKALRERYSKVAHVTGPNDTVRVICGTTLCEVAGIIKAPYRKDHEWDPKDPLHVAMRAAVKSAS